MIILWRPAGMACRDFQRVAHCWERFAKTAGEQVIVDELCDRQQSLWWDRINETHGARIVWAQPEFIPYPSFDDELKLYREDDQLIVTLKNFRSLFNLGQDKPTEWTPDGTVSHALVVFQLSGQRRWVLPRSTKVDIWDWLARSRRSNIYRLAQLYSGNAERGVASRSVLGEVIASPWGAKSFGRIATGGAYWMEPERQLSTWRNMVEGWERFI